MYKPQDRYKEKMMPEIYVPECLYLCYKKKLSRALKTNFHTNYFIAY